MKWVDTSVWLIKPDTKYTFRIGNTIYRCYFRIWKYALLSEVGKVMGFRERGMR